MEHFSITTHLTSKEYSKIMLIGLYKKPVFILSTILGLYLIITITLEYLKIPNYNSDISYLYFFCGLFLLLGPSLITAIADRQFNSNPNFHNDIQFTFSENGINIEGITFKGEFKWVHIIKQKEIGKFLILYHTKKAGNFIDKTKLTSEQLEFIKSKVNQK